MASINQSSFTERARSSGGWTAALWELEEAFENGNLTSRIFLAAFIAVVLLSAGHLLLARTRSVVSPPRTPISLAEQPRIAPSTPVARASPAVLEPVATDRPQPRARVRQQTKRKRRSARNAARRRLRGRRP